MNFQTGKTYGNYQIIDVLDSSRDGVTYKVRNRLTNRLESMKVLPVNAQDDQDRVERFLREIRVHAGLLHPNIVSFYNAAEIEGRLVMTSELVEGVALAERLTLGPLPWKEAASVMEQVLAALAYAHERCIIHRDLNPGRIVLTPEGVARINGFSLAKSIADPHLTALGAVVGSVKYISPEQVKGLEQIDGRSDIYSAGVVLYETLTGKPPFESKSQFELMSAHVNATPAPPSAIRASVPREFDAVVLKAMAKDPAERFQTATSFRRALEKFAHEPAVVVLPLMPAAEVMAVAAVARPNGAVAAAVTELPAQTVQVAVPAAAPVVAEAALPGTVPEVEITAAPVLAEEPAPLAEPAASAPAVAEAAPPSTAPVAEITTAPVLAEEPPLLAEPAAPVTEVAAAPVVAEAAPPNAALAVEITAVPVLAEEPPSLAEPAAPVAEVTAAPAVAEAALPGTGPVEMTAAPVLAEEPPPPSEPARPVAEVTAAPAVAEAAPPSTAPVSEITAAAAEPAAPVAELAAAPVVAEAALPGAAPVVEITAAPVLAEEPPPLAAPAAPVVAHTVAAPVAAAQPPVPKTFFPPPVEQPRVVAEAAPTLPSPGSEPPREQPHAPRSPGLQGLNLPVFESIFAPLSAVPIPRELMLAAAFLFLVVIAAFFAFR